MARWRGARAIGRGVSQRAPRQRLQQLSHPKIVRPRTTPEDSAANAALDDKATLPVKRLTTLVERAHPKFEPPDAVLAGPFLDLLEEARADTLAAIGLTHPDYGDKQIAAIAREVPRESRDVTDDRVVRGQCQKHHPATVVGKAA